MKLLDVTLPSPAENLALEEALLDAAEAGASAEVLRFWESPVPFVVLGYANKMATEVNVLACESKKTPVLRRCSGGGTVVQGPGCLNYAVILRITESGPTRSISAANDFVMDRIRAGIQAARNNPQAPVTIKGHTDLAISDRKFSGNAQRRRKNFLLFHGSVLLHFDLPLISALLHKPSLEPDYRAGRAHDEFIMNLELPAATVKKAIAREWLAREPLPIVPNIPPAMLGKYNSPEWNQKF